MEDILAILLRHKNETLPRSYMMDVEVVGREREGGGKNNNPYCYDSQPGREALTSAERLCASQRTF